MRVAYILPKCRFVSVLVNFGQTQYVLFLGKVMPNFCMNLMHACMHGHNSFAYTMQAIMKVSGRMVERYWQSAVDDMYEKRLKDVLCSCRKCKGGVRLVLFKGGKFKARLLMHGSMDGHTRWISEDEDDADVDGAGNNDMGQTER